MENLKKSWQTTLVGFFIIAYGIYKIAFAKEPIDLEVIVGLLVGVGFLQAKDGSASHTKK